MELMVYILRGVYNCRVEETSEIIYEIYFPRFDVS